MYSKIVFIPAYLKRTPAHKAVHSCATARTMEWAVWFGPSWVLYSQHKGGLHSCWSDTEGICRSALCSPQPSPPSAPPAPGRENQFVWRRHPVPSSCKAEFFSSNALGKAVHLPLKAQFFFFLIFFFLNQSLVIFLCVLALSLLTTWAAQARPVAWEVSLSFPYLWHELLTFCKLFKVYSTVFKSNFFFFLICQIHFLQMQNFLTL